MPLLNEIVAAEFHALAERLDREDQLLSRAQLDTCYAAFRQRFGPDALADLEGEALLMTMHERGTEDSMVYWLEFKNDDEFPAEFGSIAGGSAFKCGLFYSQSKETWITGSNNSPVEITVQQAAEIARSQRDELLLGAQALSKFTPSTEDADYERLQLELESLAPTVQNSAWGHKYFSLLFPDRMDDYHNPDYARFHLVKLLQLPPSGSGRYVTGARFVALSKQLGLPINSITKTMNVRNGRKPCTYWRIGTSEGSSGLSRWDMMQAGNCVGIGWAQIGDLTPLLQIADYGKRKAAIKDMVRAECGAWYNNKESVIGNQAAQITAFLSAILVNDVVVAMDGASVVGIGKVTGGYFFRASDPFPHQIPVDWFSHDRWSMSPPEQLRSTVRPLGKYPQHLLEIETRIYGRTPIVGTRELDLPDSAEGPPVSRIPVPRPPAPVLTGVPARVQAILDRKKQVILYGPPGTGKTFWAEVAARELAARSWFAKAADQLTADETATIMDRAVRVCAFHPAYGYEDFLEGFRPELVGGQMTFQRRDGVFKRLCAEAEVAPDRAFYLVIDEINRGDIPRIFGELLTVLEKDKRGRPILLPLSGDAFRVPLNVFIIGTMNTADRSIALLDAALRRRFGFIELMPDSSTLGDTSLAGLPLRLWLDALNRSIVAHIGRDGRSLQVGHSYFLTAAGQPVADMQTFTRVLEEDIVPLLQEYCYEDFAVLESILGQGLVDVQRRTVRGELFARDRQDELVAALIAPYAEIATALPTLAAAEAATEASAEDFQELTDLDADGDGEVDRDGEVDGDGGNAASVPEAAADASDLVNS